MGGGVTNVPAPGHVLRQEMVKEEREPLLPLKKNHADTCMHVSV